MDSWHTAVEGYKEIFKDLDNTEWIPIFMFDVKDTGTEIPTGVPQLHQSVFYNSFFVKKTDSNALYDWARKQNFCGRWMSEPSDNIYYLWNEYPWADTFLSELSEIDLDHNNRDCPVPLKVASVGQFQENSEGLPSDIEYIPSVYAPNPDVMSLLGLYTAERGVVRRMENDEVISFNIYTAGSSFTGMLMKKSFIIEYLKRTDQLLFTCLCGEKYGQIDKKPIGMKYFTGSYQLSGDGNILYNDKLHIIEPPKPMANNDDDLFDILESE